MKILEYRHRIEAVMLLRVPTRKEVRQVIAGKTQKQMINAPWPYLFSRETDYAAELAFEVPAGYSARDLAQETDALYAACGAHISLTDRGGIVIVSIGKKEFPDVIPFDSTFLSLSSGREILCGFDLLGRPVKHHFRVPHMLIGAMPGYGKTDFIRWIIFQLIARFTPEQLHIDIVDGKGFSFIPFRGIPHIRRIVRDLSGIAAVMQDARRTMEKRANVIWNADDRALASSFQWHMVFVDELAVLSPSMQISRSDKGIAEEAYANMAAVACVGREAGVGMVLCTQRPDANVVHGQVKQAMDVSIAFRTKTQTNSEIILDHAGAEKLPQNKPGRGIYSASTDTIFQSPYIGDDDAWTALLLPYKKEVVNIESNQNSDHYDNSF